MQLRDGPRAREARESQWAIGCALAPQPVVDLRAGGGAEEGCSFASATAPPPARASPRRGGRGGLIREEDSGSSDSATQIITHADLQWLAKAGGLACQAGVSPKGPR